MYAWGLNNWGQLGIGKYPNTYKAFEIESLRNVEIKDIVGGEYHTLFLLADGTVKGAGINNDFQLGPIDMEEFKALHPDLSEKEAKLVNPEAVYRPTTIKIGTPCKQILANSNYSYAVQDDNAVRTWGLGFSYILGNGKEDEIQTPHTINPKLLKNTIGQWGLGGCHVMFTAADTPYEVPAIEDGVITKIPKKRGRKRIASAHTVKVSNRLAKNRKNSGAMDQEGTNSDEALSIPEDNRSLQQRANDTSS